MALVYLLHDRFTHHLHRRRGLYILYRFSRNRIHQPSGSVPEMPNLVDYRPDPVRQVRVVLSGEFKPPLDNVCRGWREATGHVVTVDGFADLPAHNVAFGGCFEHLEYLFAGVRYEILKRMEGCVGNIERFYLTDVATLEKYFVVESFMCLHNCRQIHEL